MHLDTNLKHLLSGAELTKLIETSENVLVCCGRLGPMCLPVYDAMDELKGSEKYNHVEFRDMLFDNPEAEIIRSLPECASFMGLPFTVYYKNGKVVKATPSLQDKDQITAILNEVAS